MVISDWKTGLILGLAAGLTAGCSATNIGAPSVTGVEPGLRTTDEALRVEIIGTEFVPELTIDPAGRSHVDAKFAAQVLVAGFDAPVPLEDVRFKSTTRLIGTIPAGLPPGRFGIRVVTPTGDVTVKDNAFLNQLKPDIQLMEPAGGSVIGGGVIRVRGRYFVEGATAALGPGCPDGDPTPFTGLERENDESIKGLLPPSAVPGPVDVWVISEHGTGCLTGGFRYQSVRAPPAFISIEPDIGPTEGGTRVVITMGNIAKDVSAKIGGKGLTARAIDLEAGTLTGFTQANEPGLVNVSLEAPGAGKVIERDAFRYIAIPAIDSIAPIEGPQSGGTEVSIRGEGFVGEDLFVTFDGIRATNLRVADERTLRVTTPPGRGASRVEIFGIGGDGFKVDAFTYRQPPVLTGIAPVQGRAAGSIQVIISGERLDVDSLLVTIGGRLLAGQTPLGPDQIAGVLPAGSGTVAIAVSSPDGAAFKLGAFTYRSRPEIRVVRPRQGRPGDELEIRGSGFLADTTVDLGGTPLLSLQIHSPSHMSGIVPDGQGLVEMVAEHPFGASDPVPDAFQYEPDDAVPQLHSVHPGRGSEAGGERFWIAGASFPDQVVVRFGNATVVDAVAIDGQVIVGTVPPGNGDRRAADVIVQAGGISPRLGAAYAYGEPGPLALRSVRPVAIPEAGGAEVTVRGGGFAPLTRILIGGLPLRESVVVHDGEIRGIAPPGVSAVDIVAVDPTGGGASALLRAGLLYLADDAVAIGGVSPTAGSFEGGSLVEIRGVGLGDVDSVRFGGDEASGVEVVDDGLVRAISPEHAAGSVSVTLCITNVCPADLTLLAAFTYRGGEELPEISTIVPPVGHPAGGQRFSIFGGHFGEDVELVWADGEPPDEPIEFERVSANELTAIAPAGIGEVDVVVSRGTQFVRAVRGFRYIAEGPAIDSVDPQSGPARGAGEVITVTGERFVLGRTRVFVGASELDDVEVDGTLEALTGTLPPTAPSPAGGYTVRVETPQGAAELVEAFVVDPPVEGAPEILSIFPVEGSDRAGDPVILRGIHLDRIVAGDLGGAPLDRVRNVDASTVIAVATPGDVGGTVAVNVREADNTAYNLLAAYAYRPAPSIQSVEPDVSARVGGELVTVRFARGFTADTILTVDGLHFADANPDVGGRIFRGLLPPGDPGRQPLEARNEWGEGILPAAVRFIAPPVIDRVEPSTGLLGGGGGVAIRGSGFDVDTVATFGARALLNLRLVAPDRMEGTLPPGFGVIDVRIENDFGRSSLLEAFSYLAAPRIGAVTPFMGPVAGGTPIRIGGAGLGAETTFTIGGRPVVPTGEGVPLVRDPETAVGIVPAGVAPGWQSLELEDHRGDDDEALGFLYLEDITSLTGEGQIPAVAIRSITSHRITGAIWAATAEGLFKLDPRTDTVISSSDTPWALPSEDLRDVALEDGGAMAVATSTGGALCTSGAQLQCRQIDHRDVLGSLESLSLNSVEMLPDGSVVFAGSEGVVRADPGGKEPPLSFGFGAGGPPGTVVRDTSVGPDGRVWLATDAGIGVFDSRALSFESHDQASSGGGLGNDDVRAVGVSAAGTVWVGTTTGLFRFEPDADSWTEVFGLSGEFVHAIEVAPSGDVWVGTEGGLIRLAGDPAGIVSRRTTDDGLPDDSVLSVHVGARGGIWVGTAAGLARHAGP